MSSSFPKPASPSRSGQNVGDPGFMPFEPGTLVVSPVEDNIHKADAATARAQARIAPLRPTPGKRRRAALILPDYAARVSVLDFDSLPAVARRAALADPLSA